LIIPIFAICALGTPSVHADDAPKVVQRNTVAPATAARPSINRQPSMRVAPAPTAIVAVAAAEEVVEPVPETITPEPVITPDIPVANRSPDFASVFTQANAANAQTSTSISEQIRAQRAAFDAAGNVEQAKAATAALSSANANACDSMLRKCMIGKCGNDFEKCAGDGDTIFGDKMESCKRDTKCTGREFTLFSAQIKADRDANAMLAGFNEILDCGVIYNQCILEKCGGIGFGKCLSKSGGDAAVAECKTVAQKCQTAYSGLAARAMELFGNLRVDTEKNIASWERQLYALRDKMSADCTAGGGMFDSASFDCVFTAEMNAQGWDHPVATKKLFAGQSFMCTDDWFGVDITTFKENAARLTRSQTGASSAFLGAGLGVAAGAISSGAIGRAMDRWKADREFKKEFNKKPLPTVESKPCNEANKPANKECDCNDTLGEWENCRNISKECGAHPTDKQNCECDTESGEWENCRNIPKECGAHPTDKQNCECNTESGEWENCQDIPKECGEYPAGKQNCTCNNKIGKWESCLDIPKDCGDHPTDKQDCTCNNKTGKWESCKDVTKDCGNHPTDKKNCNCNKQNGQWENCQDIHRELPSIPSDILFDTNKYNINPKPENKNKVHEILTAAAQKINQEQDPICVIVVGLTDPSGTDGINKPLSQNRANTIMTTLANDYNVNSNRMRPVGISSNCAKGIKGQYSKDRTIKFLAVAQSCQSLDSDQEALNPDVISRIVCPEKF
jgi:outer membrane protein OmpA-like peptidoglycan-associated protein